MPLAHSGFSAAESASAPVIVTCAITGDQRQADNPALPLTLDEQVTAAREAHAAGASIIHIHGRDPDDPNAGSRDPGQYAAINDAIRAAVPGVLLDNTQATVPLGPSALAADLYAYTADFAAARPDIMSLNPGPMTFRGRGSSAGGALVTSFDDTVRTAFTLQTRGIKPQVFLYHPGGLDLLGELIARDAINSPYFVQLVFGQQGGIGASLDAFLFMTRNLPGSTIYQTCALGPAAIHANLLALIHGGHVRTGMEDALEFLPGEPASGNRQLVERVARFAADLGRPLASPGETRQMLGLTTP